MGHLAHPLPKTPSATSNQRSPRRGKIRQEPNDGEPSYQVDNSTINGAEIETQVALADAIDEGWSLAKVRAKLTPSQAGTKAATERHKKNKEHSAAFSGPTPGEMNDAGEFYNAYGKAGSKRQRNCRKNPTVCHPASHHRRDPPLAATWKCIRKSTFCQVTSTEPSHVHCHGTHPATHKSRHEIDSLRGVVENGRNSAQAPPQALDAIDRATKGQQGKRTDIVDNVNEVGRPTGNSRDAPMQRLPSTKGLSRGRYPSRMVAGSTLEPRK